MEEEQLPNWLQQVLRQKDRIFYGLLALVLIMVVGYRLSGSRSFKRQGDYAKAAHASEQILAGVKETEALGNLQAALKKHSDLRSRYDGAVAQRLLEQDELASALPYAKRALKRTADRAGPYHQFAKGSLLIAEGRFEEALRESLALQEQIEGSQSVGVQVADRAFLHRAASSPGVDPDERRASAPFARRETPLETGPRKQGAGPAPVHLRQNHLLWAYNTLRIAMLEEEMGADAKGHWEALLSWIDRGAPEGSEERAAVHQFLQAFQAGGVTMKDFAKVQLND